MSDRVLVSPAELFGDGVFETVHLRESGPWLLDAHLDRLESSAALLGLPLPPRTALIDRIAAIGPVTGERALRIICTRESWHVTVSDIPASALRERSEGVRALSAGAGFAPPWSLAAAKTLSYAPNLAARRWAQAQGADDMIWLTTDGYVLEAPTASVVWLTGDVLATVPPAEAAILPGTTAAALLARAPSVGLRPAERMTTIEELRAADAIWLASSLRGLAQLTDLDGEPFPPSPWTRRLQTMLGF